MIENEMTVSVPLEVVKASEIEPKEVKWSRRVGITGTNYRPLDNEYQIREAMEDTCQLINNKQSIFDLSLIHILCMVPIANATMPSREEDTTIFSRIRMETGGLPCSSILSLIHI